MKLIDKRKAIMQSSEVGQKIFDSVGLVYSRSGGTIEEVENGILFTSTNTSSWQLFIQSTGQNYQFKQFKDLVNHKLRLEADAEWIGVPPSNGRLIISVGFYNSTDGARAYRTKYRDIAFNGNEPMITHISDVFISDYDAYPGGTSVVRLDNFYFMFRIFLYSPAGGSCLLKNFNVYDLGEE